MTERRYLLRTFGCQMNEHDSERIGGLLTADGYVPTEEATDAQVVVFNTCAIRENADNRLYGNLGHLRPLKERNPSMRIVVAGCLAQKDGGLIQERAPWVDVVVGTHALPELLELLRLAHEEGRAPSASCRSSEGPSAPDRSVTCWPRCRVWPAGAWWRSRCSVRT
jgi:tRNA-2-methylthio-N6-dimethylallyladenosine synthase